MTLFEDLEQICRRPLPFEACHHARLWNGPHISKGMLAAHLDPNHDAASYRTETIVKGIDWIASRFPLATLRVCDFGCGPGLWTTGFAERGAEVTGLDLSTRSIDYARKIAHERQLDIRYFNQDYLDFVTNERFDLITMISGDFSSFAISQRERLLDSFYTMLRHGGSIVFDVTAAVRSQQAVESMDYAFFDQSGYWSPNSHHVFTCHFKYSQEQLLCAKYTVVEQHGQFEIFSWDQGFTIEQLEILLQNHGFRISTYSSDITGKRYTVGSEKIALTAVRQ